MYVPAVNQCDSCGESVGIVHTRTRAAGGRRAAAATATVAAGSPYPIQRAASPPRIDWSGNPRTLAYGTKKDETRWFLKILQLSACWLAGGRDFSGVPRKSLVE